MAELTANFYLVEKHPKKMKIVIKVLLLCELCINPKIERTKFSFQLMEIVLRKNNFPGHRAAKGAENNNFN